MFHIVAYYRWVPIIMLCQALLCLLPYIFWRLLNTLSPLNVTAMIRSVRRGQYSCSETERQTIIQYLSNTLKSDMEAPGGNWSQQRNIGIAYPLTKLFYVINSCAQLAFLDCFLKWDKYPEGFTIIMNPIVDLMQPWLRHELRPAKTCDRYRELLGHFLRYSRQCDMPQYEVAESMAVLMCFWFVLLLQINLFTLIDWTLPYVAPSARKEFLIRHLKARDTIGRKRLQCTDWLTCQMSYDSALAMELLSENIDDAIVSDVISAITRHNDSTCRPSPHVPMNFRKSLASTLQIRTDKNPIKCFVTVYDRIILYSLFSLCVYFEVCVIYNMNRARQKRKSHWS